MKQTLVLLLTLLFPTLLFSQESETGIKGCVIGSESKLPVPGVIVTLNGENRQTRTDVKGAFFFNNISPGKDVLILNSVGIAPKNILISAVKGIMTDIGNIEVVELTASEDMSLVGVVDEAMVDDDVEGASQEISSKVILSNDVFLNKAAYQLSPMRFRARGYESSYEQKYINGVSFNDQLRGVFNYSSVGALNDMTRNGDVVNYNAPSAFTYGSIAGAENINMRASGYAPGTKATLTYTNRNYYLRGMVTYSTGLMNNGWAFTASLGGRYSHEGAIEGTFYRNFSYALSAEKQWKGGKHSLSIVTFGSPVARGQQSAFYQQVYEYLDNYLYNPNWGYQNGKKRNAKVVQAFDPTLVLSHMWKINDNMTLTTGLGTHYGRYGNTALNWYNAPDPRPDYYRQLPSYFRYGTTINESGADQSELLWRRNDTSYTQINWDDMYLTNALGDGSAEYIVEERRSDLFETTLNSTFNARLSDHHTLTAGIELRSTLSRQFKTVNDLLGASYVWDYDKYAEQDFHGDQSRKQNDLNRLDRKVYEGGILGYNFNLNIFKAGGWIVNQHTSANFDAYYGVKVNYTSFYRDGKMRNGRYPDSSYGKGSTYSFVDMAVKGGLTYKINGRHFLTANVSYGTEAPLPNYVYLAPRITDHTTTSVSQQDLKSGRVFSADINYIFSMPSFTGRVSLFQTNFYDQMDRISYFTGASYLNHILYDMNKVHRGIELGATYKLDNHWSFDLAGTISEYYYSNNPMSVENYEAVSEHPDKVSKVYMKNLYVGGMPQFAGTFGVRYFIDYWFLGANLNAFGRNYVDVSPSRRLAEYYKDVDPVGTPQQYQFYKETVAQERFGSACTVDLSIGKIFYLPRRQSINVNLSVNNLLNKRDVRTGGYEQGRVVSEKDGIYTILNPKLLPNKYYYMQGINCFMNVSYRF